MQHLQRGNCVVLLLFETTRTSCVQETASVSKLYYIFAVTLPASDKILPRPQVRTCTYRFIRLARSAVDEKMNNFMDYFVTKENYTNRGHWARARHVSEVSFLKKIFVRRPREINSTFDIIIVVVQNNNNNNNNIPTRRRRRRAHARMRVCALVH